MKKIILFTIFYFIEIATFAQKINGQWRGYFDSDGDIVLSSSNNTEYVLELEIEGNQVSGFSYSYFQGRKYYVICKLKGTYYKNSKGIKVTETERIKGNTPPDFTDCLQVHFLTYEKEGGTEKLVGRWETAPGQRSSCGDGTTTLVRRTLSKDLSSYKKQSTQSVALNKKSPFNKIPQTTKKTAPTKTAINKNSNTAKNNSKITAPKTVTPVTKNTAKTKTPVKQATVAKVIPIQKELPRIVAPEIKKSEIPGIKSDISFEKRRADILKTIEIENASFKVDLYDNGEVDGDSVSLFYNGKLILSHKRLSEKPITLILDATTDHDINELTMYAENLGEIPPNTALMVITDGDKRYEARISSDLKNSGTIHFIHKPKTQ